MFASNNFEFMLEKDASLAKKVIICEARHISDNSRFSNLLSLEKSWQPESCSLKSASLNSLAIPKSPVEFPNLNCIIKHNSGKLFRPVWKNPYKQKNEPENKKEKKKNKNKKNKLMRKYKLLKIEYKMNHSGLFGVEPVSILNLKKFIIFNENCIPLSNNILNSDQSDFNENIFQLLFEIKIPRKTYINT